MPREALLENGPYAGWLVPMDVPLGQPGIVERVDGDFGEQNYVLSPWYRPGMPMLMTWAGKATGGWLQRKGVS